MAQEKLPRLEGAGRTSSSRATCAGDVHGRSTTAHGLGHECSGGVSTDVAGAAGVAEVQVAITNPGALQRRHRLAVSAAPARAAGGAT
ncbi:MAG TPA: hypothetical protein VFS00_31640 [Polyangiaceae bacterium]|nr:hypothetical protein [Polyangiaceae bacterium]